MWTITDIPADLISDWYVYPPPDLVIINGEEKRKVEQVLDSS